MHVFFLTLLIVQQYGMMELAQLLKNLLNYNGEQLCQNQEPIFLNRVSLNDRHKDGTN